MSSDDDIIVALATPVGKGAIAVIRLSGTGSLSLVKNFIHKDLKHTHTTYLRKFIKNNEELDQVVITTSDHGYTGQETVEISCHNSQYIIQEIIKSLIDCGARLAHPGEFTQRAFLNGQFDLIQAEAIADIIAADTKKNHDLAIKQFNGIYSCAFNGMRQQLIDIISLIELEIDFSEEDIPLIDRNDVLTALQNIKQRLQNVCDSYQRGKIIKEGLHIAIIGKPNVGKSSLLNTLLDSNRAIVSDIPGTTRDTIEATTVINGLKCIFIDTAGIHNTDNEVELLGIQRTQNVIKEAHLIIYLTDVLSMTTDDSQIKSLLNGKKYLIVVNKIDLMDVQLPQGYIGVSAKKHINIDTLCNEIVNSLPNDNEDILITNLRHYNEILCAIKDLEDCISGIINGLPNDMISVDLRSATTHIGNIVGNINNEDILNNIFSNFCIGK